MSKYPKSVPLILMLAAGALLVIIGGLYLYSTKKGSPQDITANWETYKHSELNYEFQYPPGWSPQLAADSQEVTLLYRTGRAEYERTGYELFRITVGFTSQSQLNTIGVSYCGANPNDSSRCENIKVGGQDATIDWGLKVNNQPRANVWIPHPRGGIVTFELKPFIPETKTILYLILSTFKFLDADVSLSGLPSLK